MILKSTPVDPKRARVTVHTSGVLYALSGASALLQYPPNQERMYYVEFDERDIAALKKILAALSKAKEKSK